MVKLYVGGKAVRWAEAEALFETVGKTEAVEFRDTSGRVFATSSPEPEPDWVMEITPEETARRMAGPFLTLEEWRARGGKP